MRRTTSLLAPRSRRLLGARRGLCSSPTSQRPPRGASSVTGAAALGLALTAAAAAVADLTNCDQHAGVPATAGSAQSRASSTRRFPYVIVGSGTAAHAALETLRFGDPSAEILMIAEEAILPRHDSERSSSSPASRALALEGQGAAPHEAHAPAPATAPHQAVSPLLESRLTDIFNEWRRQLSSGLETDGNNAVTLVKCERFSDVRIDVESKCITLQTPQRTRILYDKCLLATSGKPREFYFLAGDMARLKHGNLDNVNTLHTAADFKNVALMASGDPATSHVTVVGGGFLGTEVVAALAHDGACRVTHIMGEPSALAQYLPAYLSEHITARLVEDLGVESLGEELVTSIRSVPVGASDSSLSLSFSPLSQQQPVPVPAPAPSAATPPGAGDLPLSSILASAQPDPTRSHGARLSMNLVGAERLSLETDYLVLASTNVKPELVGLDAPSSTLEVAEGGIATNSALQAYDGFFVAGNAATYYDPAIGRRRVDTYDHAVSSGMWAAYNMMARDDASSGSVSRYAHQPYFRSHLAGLGLTLHGLGKIDARLETVGVWFKEGYDCIDAPVGEGGVAAQRGPRGAAGSSSAPAAPASGPAATPTTSTAAPRRTARAAPAAAIVASNGMEAGEVDVDGKSAFRRGIVYYVDRGRVVGVLLCNAGEMLNQARDALNTRRVVTSPLEELPELILLAPVHWLRIVATK